jgi:hypothetical protein
MWSIWTVAVYNEIESSHSVQGVKLPRIKEYPISAFYTCVKTETAGRRFGFMSLLAYMLMS